MEKNTLPRLKEKSQSSALKREQTIAENKKYFIIIISRTQNILLYQYTRLDRSLQMIINFMKLVPSRLVGSMHSNVMP